MEKYLNNVTLSIILDCLDRKDSLNLLSTCKYLRSFDSLFFERYWIKNLEMNIYRPMEEIIAARNFISKIRKICFDNLDIFNINRQITHLKFHFFNQPIEKVKWPDSLTHLQLGSHFDQPIEKVSWPKSPTHLEFGYKFNQPIEKVKWPDSLTHLQFGWNFNQAIENVVWSDSLTHLEFGVDFNQPIEKVTWPDSLTHLKFGCRFNQPIEKVQWPDSLIHLQFGRWFNQPIEKVKWPDSLKTLIIKGNKIDIPR